MITKSSIPNFDDVYELMSKRTDFDERDTLMLIVKDMLMSNNFQKDEILAMMDYIKIPSFDNRVVIYCKCNDERQYDYFLKHKRFSSDFL